MLKKEYRLPARNFSKLYSRGNKTRGKYGMVIHIPSNPSSSGASSENPKFGFVVSKKVGNAVKRHLYARWLRVLTHEYVARYGVDITGDFSYIAFEFPESFSDLKAEYFSLVEKAANAR